MKIILESIVEGLSTRQDGTITIKLSTQELDSTNAANLFQLRGKFCKVFLSDNNISSLEEELVDKQVLAATKKNKTASQRLRAVLYRLFEQQGYSIEFEDFYKAEIEKLIESYKSKLD
jgi:hypothetical protein